MKHGFKVEVVSSCPNRSYLWRHVKKLKFTINMRLQTLSSHDASEFNEFSNYVLRVREGTEPEDNNQIINIDTRYIIPGNSIANLVTSVYGNIYEHYAHHQYISQKIILCHKTNS